MTIEDLKLLVEKHHESIIHDIEALILEYKTRPLPKTRKEPIIPRQIIKYHFTYIKQGTSRFIFNRKKEIITIDSTIDNTSYL